MIKKIIISLVVIVSIRFFLSCKRCPEPDIYKWNSIAAETLDKGAVTSADSISFGSYGVRIAVEHLQIAYYTPDGLGNTAIALSCTEYEIESQIKSITIKTLSDFDSEHFAGSDITSYCEARHVGDSTYSPIKEMQNAFSPIPFETSNKIDMVLTEKPDSIQNYRFVIDILLENGTSFNDTTRSVKIY